MSGGEPSGDDKVLDLVGAIYDAALDTALWPDVLNRIGDAVGGPHVMFGIYDPAIGVMNLLAPRIDPEITRSDVIEYWTPRNPLLPLTAGEPPGKVFTCAEFIALVDALIAEIAHFEPHILELDPADCIFRINRDL